MIVDFLPQERNTKIIVANEISFTQAGTRVNSIYFFDDKEKKNVSYSSIEDKNKIPEIEVKLASATSLKGDVKKEIIDLTKLNSAEKTINDDIPKIKEVLTKSKKS